MTYIKKLLLLLSLIIVSSCGAWEVTTTSSPVYSAGPCSTANYQYGAWGWAWYDCYGNPVYQRHNYGPTYIPGPRIVIRSRGNTPTRVKSATPRGSGGTVNQGRRE